MGPVTKYDHYRIRQKYREILEGQATWRPHKMKPKTGSEAGFDPQQETRRRPLSKKSFITRIWIVIFYADVPLPSLLLLFSFYSIHKYVTSVCPGTQMTN